MFSKALAFLSKASLSSVKAGRRVPLLSITAAICMAVGKVSFELWLMFTWSFGCTGVFEPS